MHELDVAVHKEHMEHIHEMDLLLDPMERLADQIKHGKKKLKEDSHSRYKQRLGQDFLASSAKHNALCARMHREKQGGIKLKPAINKANTLPN